MASEAQYLRAKRYRQKHAEELDAYHKKWVEEHREQVNAYQRAYRYKRRWGVEYVEKRRKEHVPINLPEM